MRILYFLFLLEENTSMKYDVIATGSIMSINEASQPSPLHVQRRNSSTGMQSSAVHGRAVAQNSSYCEAPTLRSNATTSGLLTKMANLRGVMPTLQAGG